MFRRWAAQITDDIFYAGLGWGVVVGLGAGVILTLILTTFGRKNR